MQRTRVARRAAAAASTDAYDYVIVGGGSAGCVLANRLSADPSVSVCLVEAGPADTSQDIHMPLGLGTLLPTWGRDGWLRLTRQKLNWAFSAEADAGLGGRQGYHPRGRTLGGSSSINAMVWVRGHRQDYETWGALGNRGWGWDECRAAFEAVEEEIHVKPAVLMQEKVRPLNQIFLNGAAEALGVPVNAGYNQTCETYGPVVFEHSVEQGVRRSAAAAFLRPAEGRPNLTVRTNLHAVKVDTEEGRDAASAGRRRATGVQCVRVSDGGRFPMLSSATETIRARRRVVLSLGALQTPQLLKLSGVGPRGELEEHGIPVVHELPGVGENLVDHVNATTHCEIEPGCGVRDGTVLLPQDLLYAVGELKKYGSGDHLGSMFGHLHTECGYFAHTSANKKQGGAAAAPDLQGHFAPSLVRNHGRTPSAQRGFCLLSCLLYPDSRGAVRLHSKDPRRYPKILNNFLATDSDLMRMVDALRVNHAILGGASFDGVRKQLLFGLTPESFNDIDKLIAFLRTNVDTVYHPVSTCRMGDDETSVVDDRLAVHGMDGLSVVDASVFPTITGGNTNAPTMMVAHKAAQYILAGDM